VSATDPDDAAALEARVREVLRDTRPVVDPAHWRVPVRSAATAELLRQRLGHQPVQPAAVLVPIVPRDHGLSVLLTRRSDHLKDHAGQISFPGGRIEPSDAGPAEAALRETDEEVGIAACEVDLLGYLDTYVTGTGFAVTPVVGLVDPSAQPQANADEVAEAFEVPLSYLIDPTNHQSTSRALHGQVIEFIEITYQRHRIWGATAGIIVGFYEKLID
jgi:8-oxo-dGTP pyrophosphatase MutT (NUDIX family)